jgi:hypothetical protein
MKKFLLIFVIIIIVGIAGYLLACNFTYSEGSRTGYLMKFSKKGYVFKTFEGELNLGGMNAQNNSVLNNIWTFTVLRKNRDVIDSLEKYEGEVIKVDYKEKIKNMPWQGDTPYFVQGVKVIKRQ